MTPVTAAPLAHAFGARYDSPVPLALFVIGGAVVVLLSFLLVSRTATSTGTGTGTGAVPGTEAEAVPETEAEAEAEADDAAPQDVTVTPTGPVWLRTLSVVLLGLLIACGFLGEQVVENNLLPIAFWLVIWVALPLVVGVVGDFSGPVNPFAALADLGDSPRLRRAVLGTTRPLPWPPALGWWVAVGLFVVVVLGELVVNQQATLPEVTAAALLVYAVACVCGGLVAGAPAWCGRAELFTVLLAVWGRLGFRRFRAGGRRGFGGGLDAAFAARPSRVLFVLLLLAAVTFDGVLSTPQWESLRLDLTDSPDPAGAASRGAAVLAFAVIVAVMWGFFTIFAVWTARAGGRGGTPAGRPLRALAVLLPSLLPIAFGYQLAHYLQYILINGQLLFPLIGDPMGRGWSFLPYPFNAGYRIETGLMPIGLVWYLQIVVIVAVHVVAVVVAHRHLAREAATDALARRSEWPWLVAMVGYTMISLWLLAQPLIEHEGGH